MHVRSRKKIYCRQIALLTSIYTALVSSVLSAAWHTQKPSRPNGSKIKHSGSLECASTVLDSCSDKIPIALAVEDSPCTYRSTSSSRGPWLDKVQELCQYQQTFGDCLVPRRYLSNPSLGNWVNKQRQEYKRYVNNIKPCSLTERRISILNELGFCWTVTSATNTPTEIKSKTSSSTRLSSNVKFIAESVHISTENTLQANQVEVDRKIDESSRSTCIWWRKYNTLKSHMTRHDILSVSNLRQDGYSSMNSPSSTSSKSAALLRWINRQRQNIDSLSAEQKQALNDLDAYWLYTPRQLHWMQMYQQLLDYKKEHNGSCCVPISYAANPSLAHWVSNQRKLYNKRLKQENSLTKPVVVIDEANLNHLTDDDRIAMLNKIGFVWNHWDYEFNKSCK